MKNSLKKVQNYILVLMLTMSISFSYAATIVWNGTIDNNFNNPANWSGGVLPGPLDKAEIPPSSNVNVISNISVGSIDMTNANLVIMPSATLTASGTILLLSGSHLQNDGIIEIDFVSANVTIGIWIAQGDANNTGTIVANGGVGNELTRLIFCNVATTFTNSGIIQSNGIGCINTCFYILGTLINQGQISISNNSNNGFVIGTSESSNFKSLFDNQGTVDLTLDNSVCGLPPTGTLQSGVGVQTGIMGCLQFGAINLTNYSTGYILNGPIIINPGTPFIIPPSTHLTTSSQISGTGIIDNSGSDIVINSTIAPGNSPGIITFTNPINTPVTLELELAGKAGPGIAGGFDQVIFPSSTPSDLSQMSVIIYLIDGFQPEVMDSFPLIQGNIGTSSLIFEKFYPPGLPQDWKFTAFWETPMEVIFIVQNELIFNQKGIGVNNQSPTHAMDIADGDIHLRNPASGIILKSASGNTCSKLTINDDGVLVSKIIPCPR